MRSDILERIHRSHIGTQGCLRRARECVYWPGMTTQIKSRVTRCETCRAYERAQQKETLCSHEVSARPWAKVASDMFELVNKNYLVMVDYYSKMSKRTKTLLPTQAKLLEPKIEKTAKEKLDAARKKQALQYNKTARDLPALTAGQTVRIQPLKKPKQPWEKAEVQYQVNHRSYQLLTENGNSLRRNRRHLKATQERQGEETTNDQANTYPGDSSKEQDRTKKQMKLNTRKTSGRPREPPGTTTRNDINASKNKVGMDCKTTIISDRRPRMRRSSNYIVMNC